MSIIPKKQHILYHVGHYGFLYKMLLHKMTYHRESSAIFIIHKSNSQKTHEFLSKWNETNSDLGVVYVYSENLFRIKKLDILSLENDVVFFFDSLFEDIGSGIDEFDEIYSGYDGENAFGVYMSLNGKGCTLFSFGSTDKKWGYNLSRYPDSDSTYRKMLYKHKALSIDAEYVHNVISDAVIDYSKLQDGLSSEEKDRLVDAFVSKDLDLKGTYTLISMRSVTPCVERHIHTLSHQQRTIIPYRILIDCFCSDSEKVILKPHPSNDVSDLINKTVPDVTSISGYIPFELLQIVKDFNISRLINIGSSSTKYMSACADFLHVSHIQAYFEYYTELISLDVSLHMLKGICGKDLKIYIDSNVWDGSLSPLLGYLMNESNLSLVKSYDIQDSVRIIIGVQQKDIDLKSDEGLCTILVNPDFKGISEVYDESVIFEIKKISNFDDSINYVGDLDSEFLILSSGDESILETAKNFKLERRLYRCGLTIKCSSISLKEYIIKKRNLSGNIIYRTAKHGNRKSLEYIWNLLSKNMDDHNSDSLKFVTSAFHSIVSTLADSGNEDGMRYMSMLYDQGIYVEKNIDKRLYWAREATKINPDFKRMLYSALLSSGKVEDLDELKLHADENDLMAKGYLGIMYRRGTCVEKNIEKSILYLREAIKGAKWWNVELYKSLSKSDNPYDNVEAFYICNKLAEGGNAGAKASLGYMYRDGRGTEKNLEKAIEYMREAAGAGLTYAKRELDKLKNLSEK